MTDDTSGATKTGGASRSVPEGHDRERTRPAGNSGEREASSAEEEAAIDLDTARDRAS